ncbi:MAG: cob(I)yrinic acid a,c-diamide adenosyltransferase [Acidiferrobacteraceae bacterium]
MGHRLSRIYTRTGDRGTTGLGDGTRVDKDDATVHAMGDIDELNSIIGILLTETLPEPAVSILSAIQHELFDLGAELAVPGSHVIEESQVTRLEQELDGLNASLAPLKEFILPGGSRAAALCHLARAVCRRAERSLVGLGRERELGEALLMYINRLSDLLFVLARTLNLADGRDDVQWRPAKTR